MKEVLLNKYKRKRKKDNIKEKEGKVEEQIRHDLSSSEVHQKQINTLFCFNSAESARSYHARLSIQKMPISQSIACRSLNMLRLTKFPFFWYRWNKEPTYQ